MEIHHAINGKTHYFNGPCSSSQTVTNYQRVSPYRNIGKMLVSTTICGSVFPVFPEKPWVFHIYASWIQGGYQLLPLPPSLLERKGYKMISYSIGSHWPGLIYRIYRLPKKSNKHPKNYSFKTFQTNNWGVKCQCLQPSTSNKYCQMRLSPGSP